MEPIKKTSFHSIFKELGAKLVPFAGWEMPVKFSGQIEEHLHVRNHVGVFDVSHMGEIVIRGKKALQFVNYLVTNNVEPYKQNKVTYTLICNHHGKTLDDILVYPFSETHIFLCVNAANVDKDFEWIKSIYEEKKSEYELEIENVSDLYSQLAIQGPKAVDALQTLLAEDISELKYYHAYWTKINGTDVLLSRTGYTGEIGFEIYFNKNYSEKIWNQFFDLAKKFDPKPIGLGARDTLRLEAGFHLYGNDMNEETSPLEASLRWAVKMKKGDFVGRGALQKEIENGSKKRLIAFKLEGQRQAARHDYKIVNEKDKQVGQVTSGAFSPSLKESIGMGYVNKDTFDNLNQKRLFVKIRNKNLPLTIVEKPFFKDTSLFKK